MENIKFVTAKAVIDELFSDTSVSPQITKANLEELRDEIEIMINALDNDGEGC